MDNKKISKDFMTFNSEAPKHSAAWGKMVQELSEANVLDKKTGALVYLGILAALGRESGIPFHVAAAKNFGASREEIISAILLGLPAAGHIVTQSLPVALDAYDN